MMKKQPTAKEKAAYEKKKKTSTKPKGKQGTPKGGRSGSY